MGSFSKFFAVAGCLLVLPFGSLADDCQPHTWKRSAVGDVSCRYTTETSSIVDSALCSEYAALYRIDLEQFMALNPDLDSSCSNIQPKTEYCVRGFVRSTSPSEDGFCGQAHGNATCAGTETPCCNGLTGKCGSSSNECGLEVCDYRFSSGCTAVPQDAASVLDGNACCNSQGNCGNGPEFCGMDVCESGNCTINIFEMPKIAAARGSLPWLNGTTTDGTCGGEDKRSCDVVFGRCCGPDGFCASDEKACGEGCQPDFGQCS